MIHTSTQLKALVKNKSHGDNAKAMTLIRNFVMERFLERMSLSKYSSNLILKGGLLIASMVGLDNRATMDIDTTIRNYDLSPEDAEKRDSYKLLSTRKHILEQIKSDAGLMKQWGIYKRKCDHVSDCHWEDIVKNIEQLFEKLM